MILGPSRILLIILKMNLIKIFTMNGKKELFNVHFIKTMFHGFTFLPVDYANSLEIVNKFIDNF